MSFLSCGGAIFPAVVVVFEPVVLSVVVEGTFREGDAVVNVDMDVVCCWHVCLFL